MAMRRFQMLIESDLYEALVRHSAREGGGASVAALLRRFAREGLEQKDQGEDPLLDDVYEGPIQRGNEPIDDTIYGSTAR